MDLGMPALSLLLALDGESATGNSTGIAVISLVSIVFGYLLLAGLWYFVFRDKDRAKRKKGPSD
jgi:predicted permease